MSSGRPSRLHCRSLSFFIAAIVLERLVVLFVLVVLVVLALLVLLVVLALLVVLVVLFLGVVLVIVASTGRRLSNVGCRIGGMPESSRTEPYHDVFDVFLALDVAEIKKVCGMLR